MNDTIHHEFDLDPIVLENLSHFITTGHGKHCTCVENAIAWKPTPRKNARKENHNMQQHSRMRPIHNDLHPPKYKEKLKHVPGTLDRKSNCFIVEN